MACSECNRDREIVNKHFGLCQDCNNIRLHGSKYGKTYTFNRKDKKSGKPAETRVRYQVDMGTKVRKKKGTKKTDIEIKLDNDFYLECFKQSDHKCEECGTELPDFFLDDNFNVAARWRYSHVIPKSIASHLRRDINNINHLCLEHHTQWDFGDKKSMNIYEKNKERFPEFLD